MKYTLIFLIFILFVMILGCVSKNKIKTNHPQVFLDTITIGTHQYLYIDWSYSNNVLCHYEDCNNPKHKNETK